MSLPFHHKKVSHLKAEELLLDNKLDGSFLVRDSESTHGAYAVCLLFQGRIYTYRILTDDSGKFYLQTSRSETQRKYSDLGQLIHECQRREKSQFICPLKHAVEVEKQPLDDEKESDDDVDAECYEEVPTFSNEYSASSISDDFITRHFLQRFSTLDLSSFDGQFIDDIRTYIELGMKTDAEAVISGEEKAKHLRSLLTKAASDLDRTINVFLDKVDVCRRLFGQSSDSIDKIKAQDRESNTLTGILDKAGTLKNAVVQLERKAIQRLQYLSPSGDGTDSATHVADSRQEKNLPMLKVDKQLYISPTNFNAKCEGFGKLTQKEVILTVDVQAGKLLIVRPTKDCLDNSNTFTHDRILQLIKSTSNNCQLDLKLEGRKKEAYLFKDVRERENFCQLVQQLKNIHSAGQTVDDISVFIGTWNMGEAPPPACSEDLIAWLKSQGTGFCRDNTLGLIPHDLYVIGTQESGSSEKEWTSRLRTTLLSNISMLKDLHTVATVSLWGIRLVVFVKGQYKHKISHVQTSTVGTGIANTLGNKGAVGVSFYFDGTAFCFVNCHLTSGHEQSRLNRRAQNFRDILKGLSLSNKQLQTFDLTNKFHHLFWFGDLNYRLNEDNIQVILKNIKDKNYSPLLENDQLGKSQEKSEAFFGFNEQDITFPPTYRFEKGSQDHYVYQKFKKTGVRINVPSWCDRVLWRSYPKAYFNCTSYGMVERVCTSDHKPVFSSFNVGIASQYVSTNVSNTENADVNIVFKKITAKIKTSCKQKFLIEFYSSCLEGPETSKPNDLYDQQNTNINYCCPTWKWDMLPKLTPIIGDVDYLEDQHILIAIKTEDGMESYGECVVALKCMFSTTPQPFECTLTHGGEVTGRLSGSMNVKSPRSGPGLSRRRLRSYELVHMDTQMTETLEPQTRSVSPMLTVPAEMPRSIRTPSSPSPDPEEYSYAESPLIAAAREKKEKSNTDTKSVSKNEPDDSHSCSKSTFFTKAEGLPLIPPRKPRLGQSSLNQSSVLPVVSPTKPCSLGIMTTVKEDSNSANALPVPKKQFTRTPSKRDGVANHRSMEVSNSFHTEDNEDEIDYEKLDESISNTTTPACPPPPLPRKTTSTTTNKRYRIKSDPQAYFKDTYEGLVRPQTVNEWLLNLGLPEYISVFFENGWDQIEFVGDITDINLLSMDVLNQEHRKRILDSLKDMKI